MKIAFVVLAHRHPEQLNRLLIRLSDACTSVYLHVDRGTPNPAFRGMQQALAGIENLEWLPRLYSHWGSWGLVQASLNGLEQVLKTNCEYAILLSGQDYPIKPIPELIAFLEQNNGCSFLQYNRLPSDIWPPDGASRYTRWHFNLGWQNTSTRKLANRSLNRLFNTMFSTRTLPDGLSPFGGWQWWCLYRDCIEYILHYTHSNPRAVRFFKYVRIPDEMYFQTVLLNSPLSPKIQNRLLTYADWSGPPYPRVLMQADFEKLKHNEAFFARKFDIGIDIGVVDRIDHELL